jgi:hypothetical protein
MRQLILVDEGADAVASLDLAWVGSRSVEEWTCGSSLPQPAVRPMAVVMAFELAQHGCGVSLVDDQQAVEEFAADGADEAFGDRVGPRCAHRRLDDSDVDGGQAHDEGVDTCQDTGSACPDGLAHKLIRVGS